MSPKSYLVFCQSFPKNVFSVYQWNEEKQWWLNQDGGGFSLEKVSKYNDGGCFNQFDTMKEVEEFKRYKDHSKKYGSKIKTSTDFSCPNCGYNYYDDREYDSFNDYEIKCLCGHKIQVKIKISYVVE